MPQLVFGTMTFGTGSGGRIQDRNIMNTILDLVHQKGCTELDTARMYCDGNTEQVLQELQVSDRFKIATKAFPFSKGDLSFDKIQQQFQSSLRALGQEQVDLFYLHAPDHVTPIEETLKAVHKMHQEGKFKRFGLSNYSGWQVMEIYHLCKTNGYILPTVYQGRYNILARDIEGELMPCLRRLNIQFYCYNPLLGGLLSGKYDFDQPVVEGRFDQNTNQGQKYRERFWKKQFFEAVAMIHRVCDAHGLTMVEVAHRWLVHHSLLQQQDAIIIGASSLEHVQTNISDLEKEPLPESVLTVLDEAWLLTKPVVATYYR
ncbi:Aldo/keto reductase [Gorgonomyces haynaldii]|nr:Aldo/keto reductase [Gorgonomyces haynaldii]